MNKQQILYVLKENESLKMKVQRLEQSTERLQNRYYDAENELNTFKRKYDFLSDQFSEIVRECFPREFIDLNMRGWSEKELYEFLKRKIEDIEGIAFGSSTQIKKLKEALDDTESELTRLKNAGPMIAYSEDVDGSNEEFSSDGNATDEGNSPSKTIGSNTASAQKPKQVKNEEDLVLGLLGQIEEKEWPIIKVVGEGETQFGNIASTLGIANSTVSDILNALQEKNIITFEKIQKGGRGRPAHHYFLTPLGMKLFEKKYKNKAEKTKLQELSTHGSPAHGGLMHEVGQFLEENGCEVIYDGPDTTYKLKDGRDIIFDIKAYDPQSKENIIVETERAKCGDKHLQEKFDKCYEFTKLGITKTIHVIAPDKQALHQIQQQLFRWVRKNANTLQMLQKDNTDRAVVIFKTATLEDFKKGKLQEFFYGVK